MKVSFRRQAIKFHRNPSVNDYITVPYGLTTFLHTIVSQIFAKNAQKQADDTNL